MHVSTHACAHTYSHASQETLLLAETDEEGKRLVQGHTEGAKS